MKHRYRFFSFQQSTMGHTIVLSSILIYILVRILEPHFPSIEQYTDNLKSKNKSSSSSSSTSSHTSPLVLLPCIPTPQNSTPNIPETPCKITLVITMCEKRTSLTSVVPKELQKLKFSFSRQTNQTLTLIKSIALSMRHGRVKGITGDQDKKLRANVHLELLIFSNHLESFDRLKFALASWDKSYTQNLHLLYQEAVYLKGYEWMENLYAPCSTLRLLLPQLLPKVDSIIYTDTDIIFFEHILKLWNELAIFEPMTQVGMVRSRRQFNVRPLVQKLGLVKIPAYNSGVMLMNLTRLREDEDWKSWLLKGCQMYEEFLQWADQDIMDVYFYTYPSRLKTLPCLWNFVPPFFVNQTLCNPTGVGASILHGISSHFFKAGRIGLIYKKFEEIQFQFSNPLPFSIEKFVQNMKDDFRTTNICQVYDSFHNCDNNYFFEAITKKLVNYF